MLEGPDGAFAVVNASDPYVTDTIWIGKMNKIRMRVDMSKPENRTAVEKIERQQRDSEIRYLYQVVHDNPKIRWKDSIKEVISRL
jgi:hypothetical protein